MQGGIQEFFLGGGGLSKSVIDFVRIVNVFKENNRTIHSEMD